MKRKALRWMLLTAVLLTAVFCLSAAMADEIAGGTCGESLTWSLDSEGHLTIAGRSGMTTYSGPSATPWYPYKSQIRKLTLGPYIESVSRYAFQGFTDLQEVVIRNPFNLLKTIGNFAFSGCTGLEKVNVTSISHLLGIHYETADSNPLNYAEHLYVRDTEVTDLVIPNGVRSIDNYAFVWCTGLHSVTIPDSVTSIGSNAFRKCTGLTQVTLPSGLTSLGSDAFSGCESLTEITLPGSVTDLGLNVFADCTALTSVTMEAGLPQIGYSMFTGCTSLTEVVVPEGVTVIGEHAFRWCSSLQSITLPKGLNVVDEFAFDSCTALSWVYFTGSERGWNSIDIRSVNTPLLSAVRGYREDDPSIAGSGTCGSGVSWSLDTEGLLIVSGSGRMTSHPWTEEGYPPVRRAVIRSGVTEIAEYAFDFCQDLTYVSLPYGITAIGSGAFMSCNRLNEIRLPNTLTAIGDEAFWGSGLRKVVIPDSVVSLGNMAFYFSEELTDLKIGSGIRAIGDEAFSGTRVSSVVIPASVTTIGERAFYRCNNLTQILVDDNNTKYTDQDFVLFSRDMTELIVWPAARQAETYDIPAGVVRVREYSFYDALLSSISIPASVTDIGYMAFTGNSLQNITVAEGNPAYKSEDGVLFSRDGTVLLTYPTLKKGAVYRIPDGVTCIENFAFCRNYFLQSIFFPAGLKAIHDNAFWSCSSITEVFLPNGVTSLGDYAFSWCTRLCSIRIPDSVTSVGNGAFNYCTKLEEITLPTGITTINSSILSDCGSLKTVILTAGVTEIRDYAFSSCSALETVYFTGTQAQWDAIRVGSGNEALTGAALICNYSAPTIVDGGACGENLRWTLDSDGLLRIWGTGPMEDFDQPWYEFLQSVTSVVVEEGVTVIGGYAFYDCRNLTEIILPESVTDIRFGAFADCVNLTNISLPIGLTTISEELFYGCGNLPRVTIPAGVTSIGKHAFYECASLTDVTIPESVTSIGYSAFYGCDLTELTIPKNVASIGGYAFTFNPRLTSIQVSGDNGAFCSVDGVLFDREMKTLVACPAAKTGVYTVPDTVTRLAEAAFATCENLTELRLPAGLTDIEYGAFAACTGLTELRLPYQVRSIAASAFFRCLSLTEIAIPEGVTELNKYAFQNCTSLTDITLPGSLTAVGESAFEGCTGLARVHFTGTATQWSAVTIGENNEPLTAAAVDYITLPGGTCGENLTWRLDSTGTLIISGTGDMDDWESHNDVPWRNVSSMIRTLAAEEGVTSIGNNTFFLNSTLEQIILPQTLQRIGDYAFMYCPVRGQVDIPAGVTEIGLVAFTGCGELTAFRVDPENPAYASLDGVLFDKALETLITFPCPRTGEYQVPDGVKEIGVNAFYGSNLTQIRFPDSLTVIGDSALNTCQFTEIVLPEGVTDIGGSAFYNCSFLETLTLPASLQHIGFSAFNQCQNLADVWYGGKMSDWQAIQLDNGNEQLLAATIHYTYPTERTLALPAGLTAIESEAFAGLTDADAVYVPATVTEIAEDAFAGSDIVILTPAGSAAEQWALDHQFPCIPE